MVAKPVTKVEGNVFVVEEDSVIEKINEPLDIFSQVVHVKIRYRIYLVQIYEPKEIVDKKEP